MLALLNENLRKKVDKLFIGLAIFGLITASVIAILKANGL